jgi:hypothetical protein
MLRSNPEIVRPRCPKCGAVMDHASVMPGLGKLAERIFECSRCGHVQMVSKLASVTSPQTKGTQNQ